MISLTTLCSLFNLLGSIDPCYAPKDHIILNADIGSRLLTGNHFAIQKLPPHGIGQLTENQWQKMKGMTQGPLFKESLKQP